MSRLMQEIQNICKKTIAVSMAAFVFFSCSNENLLDNGEDSVSGEIVQENITLTFLQDDDSPTRLQSSEGDGISVTYALDGVWRKSFYKSEPQSASDIDGGFMVKTDLSSDLTGSLVFYGLYPQMDADIASLPSVPIAVRSKQKPSATSWDKSAEVLVGRSAEEYDSVPSKPICLRWDKVLTYLCLSFSNLSLEEGETLESVEISAGEGTMIAGDCILDMETSECEPNDSGSSSLLTLDISSLKVLKSGDLDVWSVLVPAEMKTMDVTLTTSKARYSVAISDFNGDFLSGQENELEIDLARAQKEVLPQGVYRELFDIINLDYPGLESVKVEYLKADFDAAADALVDYFRTRSVYDPAIDITKTVMYEEDRRVADQSLEHRFCVRRSYWYESVSDDGKHYTYWDFDDEDGNINWDFVLPGAGQENYQIHWHQWFKYVAWAQVLTGDDKYFNNWKEIYSDWLEHFPCPGPDGSIHAYGNSSWRELAVATRISSQIDLLPYFITSKNFTGEWLATVLVELYRAVEFCRAKPYYEPSSNIRFAQLTAESKAAMLLPEFRASQDWLAHAAPQISSQFTLQFYEDGVHTEMAPNYQLGVITNFQTIYDIAKANGRLKDFDPEYAEKMRLACLFIANYIWPDYTWEWFNDTFRQTKNVLLRNIKSYYSMFPEENLLRYLASERKEGHVPTESLIPFANGGYYVLRSGWDGNETMFILKNNFNPQNEAHCHMDNGTFALWSKGRNFLPDPGVYTYGGTNELDAYRDAYLSTARHNTLTKNLRTIQDGYSHGECLLTRTSPAEDLVVTRNQSYSDLTHRRAVYMLDKKYFVIVDEAYGGASKAEINLSFHLCEGKVVADDYSDKYAYGVHTEFSDGNDMLLRTFSESTRGFKGETGTSGCSPKMNESYDRTYYRVTVDKINNTDVSRFITVICPSRSAEISAYFSSDFDQRSSSVNVNIDGQNYNLSYEF